MSIRCYGPNPPRYPIEVTSGRMYLELLRQIRSARQFFATIPQRASKPTQQPRWQFANGAVGFIDSTFNPDVPTYSAWDRSLGCVVIYAVESRRRAARRAGVGA